jgi:hypothetical protein
MSGMGAEYPSSGGFAQPKGGSRFAKLWDADGRSRPGFAGAPGAPSPMDPGAFPGAGRDPNVFHDGFREPVIEDRVANQLQALMNGAQVNLQSAGPAN